MNVICFLDIYRLNCHLRAYITRAYVCMWLNVNCARVYFRVVHIHTRTHRQNTPKAVFVAAIISISIVVALTFSHILFVSSSRTHIHTLPNTVKRGKLLIDTHSLSYAFTHTRIYLRGFKSGMRR